MIKARIPKKLDKYMDYIEKLHTELEQHMVLTGTKSVTSSGLTETTNYPVIVSPPGAGMALDFDGSADYIDLGEYTGSDPIGLTTSNFTISFWIKPDLSGDSHQRIIDKSVDGLDHLRSCRDVACYVSTVHLPQNEQYQ